MKTRAWLGLVSLFLSITLPTSAQTASPRYKLTLLPLYLEKFDQLDDLEHGGDINGTRIIGSQSFHAGNLSDARDVLWQWRHPLKRLDRTPITPHDPNSSFSSSLTTTALNSHGDVVGYSYYRFSGAYSGSGGTAFLLRAGQTTKESGYFPTAGAADLTGFPGDTDSSAIGINDHGDIVGNVSYNTHSPNGIDYSLPASILDNHAYLRRGGQIKILWPGFARGLNNKGQIIGTYQFHNDIERKRDRGVLWQNGQFTFLPKKMQPMAINDRGWIAGNIPLNDDLGKACLWRQGQVIRLSTQISHAFALNNQGQVVGEIGTDAYNHRPRATLWERGHTYDLTQCVHLPHGWRLETALGINDKGWIIGEGSVQNSPTSKQPSKSFTFLLTPR